MKSWTPSRGCQNTFINSINFFTLGLEVAAFGVDKGEASSVDVVGQSPTPFAKVFGSEVGARITKVSAAKKP